MTEIEHSVFVIFGCFLCLAGFYLLYDFGGWHLAGAIFLLKFGNNINIRSFQSMRRVSNED